MKGEEEEGGRGKAEIPRRIVRREETRISRFDNSSLYRRTRKNSSRSIVLVLIFRIIKIFVRIPVVRLKKLFIGVVCSDNLLTIFFFFARETYFLSYSRTKEERTRSCLSRKDLTTNSGALSKLHFTLFPNSIYNSPRRNNLSSGIFPDSPSNSSQLVHLDLAINLSSSRVIASNIYRRKDSHRERSYYFPRTRINRGNFRNLRFCVHTYVTSIGKFIGARARPDTRRGAS